ncbi:hypothetical protein RUM44_013007 [Polyplax serrata]|uniref:Potassium channel domain-containing protein n=1 Tax=Polyplax serrata TaxID=468196 RepID=A0ABR1BCX6_POLSC
MSIRNGYEKLAGHYERPPPSYTEIDENKLLLSKESDENVKQVLGMRRSTFLLCLYLVFYGVFLVTGGLVFAVLESPGEEEVKISLIKARAKFLEENPCVKAAPLTGEEDFFRLRQDQTPTFIPLLTFQISDDSLEELIEKIIRANNRGVSAVRNVSGDPNWNFGQSLFFASTVVTTIGYGHVTPLSKIGKFFCIIYAILGIPLTLMLLTAMIERLKVPSDLFLRYLNSKLGHVCQPLNIQLLHLCVIGSILFTCFWFIPAAVFAYLEPEWDFLDSMYYCFISLTTIGLGDYIPGEWPHQANRPLYQVLTTGYLFSGLIFLMFTLTVFYEIPQLNFGIFFLLESDEEPSSSVQSEKVKLNSSRQDVVSRQNNQSDIENSEKQNCPSNSTYYNSIEKCRAETADMLEPYDYVTGDGMSVPENIPRLILLTTMQKGQKRTHLFVWSREGCGSEGEAVPRLQHLARSFYIVQSFISHHHHHHQQQQQQQQQHHHNDKRN